MLNLLFLQRTGYEIYQGRWQRKQLLLGHALLQVLMGLPRRKRGEMLGVLQTVKIVCGGFFGCRWRFPEAVQLLGFYDPRVFFLLGFGQQCRMEGVLKALT